MPDSRMRIFLTFVSALVLVSLARAQEAAPFAFQLAGQGNPFRAMMVVQVQNELNCAKIVAELSDDQADKILENLDDLIEEEAEKAIQGGDPMAAMGGFRSWGDAVLVEAKEILPEKAFKTYQADLALRNKFQRRGAQRAFLSGLDRYLQLNNKQQAAVAKVLMSSWKDGWNQLGQIGSQAAVGLITIKGPLKELPQDELKAAMSESQWAALEGIFELEMTAMADQVGLANLQGSATGMLKLEEMTELCGLSEAQSAKLRKTIDTVLAESLELKSEAMKAIQGGNFQMEAIQDIGRPVQQMMFKSDSWTETVDEVLTKEQAAKYAVRQESRDKRNAASVVSTLATSLSQQAGGMTGKQQIALAKMFEKKFPGNLAEDPLAMTKTLVDIPDEEYKKILNDQQWEKMSAMLQAMGQQVAGGGIGPPPAITVEQPDLPPAITVEQPVEEPEDPR